MKERLASDPTGSAKYHKTIVQPISLPHPELNPALPLFTHLLASNSPTRSSDRLAELSLTSLQQNPAGDAAGTPCVNPWDGMGSITPGSQSLNEPLSIQAARVVLLER